MNLSNVTLLAVVYDGSGRGGPAAISPYLSTPWQLIASSNATTDQIRSAQAFIDVPMSVMPDAAALALYQYSYTGYPEEQLADIPRQATVCNCHQSSVPIAEYTLAAILDHNVKLRAQDAAMREACWSTGPPGNTCFAAGVEMRQTKGLTLGILGYGHIGQAIAQRAAGFEMKIIATDVAAQDPPPAPLSWLGDD